MEKKTDDSINKEEYFTILKDKNSFFILQPLVDENKKLWEFEGFSFLKSYRNDKIIGIKEGIIFFYVYSFDFNIKALEVKLKYQLEDHKQVIAVDISPKGSYLVSIQHPSVNDNLKIIDLNNGSVLCCFKSTTHPGSGNWPQIKFLTNEVIIGRKKDKGVEFLDISDMKSIKSLTNIETVYAYDLITYEQDFYIAMTRIKTVEAKKTKKLVDMPMVSLFKYPDFQTAVSEISSSQMHRAVIKQSSDGRNVLINSISDESNKDSYYGNTSLYHINIPTGKIKKISGLKEGPFHDFCFDAEAKRFYVVCGHQPSSTYVLDADTGNILSEITKTLKVNAIRISPNNKVICLFGSSSLRGDVYSIDSKTYQILGKADCFGTHDIRWSQSGKVLMSNVVSPYLNVDNDIKLLTYNCEVMLNKVFNFNIYDCQWLNIYDINHYKPDIFELKVSDKYKEAKEKEKTQPVKKTGNISGNQIMSKPVFFNSTKK